MGSRSATTCCARELGAGVNDGGSGGETNGDTVSYEDLAAASAVTVNLDTDNRHGRR